MTYVARTDVGRTDSQIGEVVQYDVALPALLTMMVLPFTTMGKSRTLSTKTVISFRLRPVASLITG